MPIRDGQQPYRHRTQPQGKAARKVLYQDTEEALYRAEERTVDHHRALPAAVGRRVFQLELVGKGHVQLDSATSTARCASGHRGCGSRSLGRRRRRRQG